MNLSLSVIFAAGLALQLSACSNGDAKPNIVVKDPPREGVVAKIAGQEVTLDELIGDAKLQYLELQKRLYDFKMDQVKRLMEERLVGEKAKAAGLSLNDFIEQKVVKGKLDVSEKDIENFIKEKNINRAQVNPQLKDKIREYMGNMKREKALDAYVAGLTKGTAVEVYFKKPKLDIKVEIGDAPAWGSKDAKVQLVAFSDFQCPYCSKGADIISEVKKKYGSKVTVAFKHFPLSFHPDAKPAAEAAMCVREQNADKFWKYHDILFKNQQALKADDLAKYAKDVGVNEAKFKECFDSHKFAKAIEADQAYGEKIGVRSTPTFFVNGEIISGAVPIEEFSTVIDDALAGK